MNRDIVLLAGIAGGALLLGLIASGVEKSVVKAEIKKARDELFDVGPNCETISWRGGDGSNPDPARLEQAGTYYFRPFLREQLGAGMDRGMAPAELAQAEAEILGVTLPEFLTAKVLYELFPECSTRDPMPWPPDDVFTSFGMIWLGMSLYIGAQMETVMAQLAAES
jgi:hypothetical protein